MVTSDTTTTSRELLSEEVFTTFIVDSYGLPEGLAGTAETFTFSEPESSAAFDFIDTTDPDTGPFVLSRDGATLHDIRATLTVTEAGSYSFYILTDNETSLWIDGAKTESTTMTFSGRTYQTITLDLDAGTHDVNLRYLQTEAAPLLRLEWRGADTNDQRLVLEGEAITSAGQSDPSAISSRDPADAPLVDRTVNLDDFEVIVEVATADTTIQALLDQGGNGLVAEYFRTGGEIAHISEIDFSKEPVAVEVVTELNHVATEASFWSGGSGNLFAARYTGKLLVETAGSHTIYLTSDDGSQLFVDGELVIDMGAKQRPTEKAVTLDLDLGAHDIEIRYFDNYKAQTLKLEWQTPADGAERSLVGESNLVYGAHAPVEEPMLAGLEARYFEAHRNISAVSNIDFTREPDAIGSVTEFNIMKSAAPFWEGGVHDGFGAQYSGLLNVKQGGIYKLLLTSDDGSILFIDGVEVINNDGAHRTRTREVELSLEAGHHEIELFYFERRGKQSLKLEWQGPDSDDEIQVISGDSLLRPAPEPVLVLSETDPVFAEEMEPVIDEAEVIVEDPRDAIDTTADTTDAGGSSSGSETTTVIEDTVTDSTDAEALAQETNTESPTSGMDHPAETTSDTTVESHTDHAEMTDTTAESTDHAEMTDMTVMEPTDHTSSHDTMTTETDHMAMHDGPSLMNMTEAEFVHAIMMAPESGDGHAHGDGSASHATELLNLVPRGEATHVAIRDGDWFDPNTWFEGRIPDADAKVLIPEMVSVVYNGESDASMFTVRVDGQLSFATDVNTKMVLDTMVVAPTGRLEIGTEENPIQAGVTADIVVASNGPIDTNWDPTLLSRGVISHGESEIHGVEKTAFLKVDNAPMKGATEITLQDIPENWMVGDSLIVTGTHKRGWTLVDGQKQWVDSQDEEVEIVAINGNTVTINTPLQYNHDTPRDDLFAYVANMSRNITVSSELGEDTPVNERGHVMFMHNDKVDVRYAAFEDLGRTDKSIAATDVEKLADVTSDSNIKGRYAFHFHKLGVENQDEPAIAIGNAVDGSPGWGFVHHSSNADFISNVAYDVFGAAFAAEDGDETGIWQANMAIKSEGIGAGHTNVKSGEDVHRHDNGRTGDGFFFAGRLVEAADNVAVNTSHGYVWMSRSAPMNPDASTLDNPEITYGKSSIATDEAPIQGFHDNEAFGTQVGLIVVKPGPQQRHDVRTVMEGFLNWETSIGVELTYTAHYTLKDFDLLGTTNGMRIAKAQTGFDVGNLTFDLTVNGLKAEGFQEGLNLSQRTTVDTTPDDIAHNFIDLEFANNAHDIVGFNPDAHQILTSADLEPGRLSFEMHGDTSLDIGQDLYFDGIKTDSIGARERQFGQDIQMVEGYTQILSLLRRDGFFQTEDGKNIMFLEDLIADRATGELLKFSHVITLNATEEKLVSIGAENHGLIKLDSLAPVVGDDHAETHANAPVVVDVLANDSDADSAHIAVDGMTNPTNGDVTLLSDGTLLYTPKHDYHGVDSFSYWATDDEGHYTKGTVVVDVWDV